MRLGTARASSERRVVPYDVVPYVVAEAARIRRLRRGRRPDRGRSGRGHHGAERGRTARPGSARYVAGLERWSHARVLSELDTLTAALAPLIARLTDVLARSAEYDTRSGAMVGHAHAGQSEWVDRGGIDACHLSGSSSTRISSSPSASTAEHRLLLPSEELFESAAIDGASSATVLIKVVLPLSKAVLAVIGLFYAVSYWNAFFNALLYIHSAEKWPMALVLRTFVVNQTALGGNQVMPSEVLPPQLSMQMAILVLATVPILLVYPFLQRHFAKGVMIGAVKG